eukprot:63577-Chlamydomonas_euryale.AAC.2
MQQSRTPVPPHTFFVDTQVTPPLAGTPGPHPGLCLACRGMQPPPLPGMQRPQGLQYAPRAVQTSVLQAWWRMLGGPASGCRDTPLDLGLRP